MRRRSRRSSSSNGPPPPPIAKFGVILALFMFTTCISLACTSEIDDDLVFDDDYQTLNGHKSHSSSHESRINEPSDDVHFFRKLVRPIRDAFWDSWLFGPSKESSSTTVTEKVTGRTRRDTDGTPNWLSSSESDGKLNSSIKRNKLVKKSTSPDDPPASNDRDLYDEEDPPDDTEDIDEAIDSSGNSPSNVSTSEPTPDAEKSYFRLIIYLYESYSPQLSSKSSVEFRNTAAQLSSAIDAILRAPDFAKSSVVGITNTKDVSISKAVIDLETSGSESQDKIEENLRSSLVTNNNQLGSLFVVPDRLSVIQSSSLKKCRDDQLPCDIPTSCFRVSARCDNHTNCPDLSDQKDCPNIDEASILPINDTCRGDDKYLCPEGILIICDRQRCDGVNDCPSGEDEAPENCDFSCKEEEFKCNGRCVSIYDPIKCDKHVDCIDSADEKDCPSTTTPVPTTEPSVSSSTSPPTTQSVSFTPSTTSPTPRTTLRITSAECPPGQYLCYDLKTCFNSSQRCDNVPDCPEGEDESGCPSPSPATCPPSSFQCGDGTCIPRNRLCDGSPDCSDYSDESDPQCHTCTPDQFQCFDRRKCIPLVYRCDGVPDCDDRSDESPVSNCNFAKCLPNEFMCKSRHRCILGLRRCDGIPDCRDGSDEENCTTPSPTTTPIGPIPCRIDQFRCLNGECIPRSYYCDQRQDCSDNSDELYCPTRGPPEYLNLKAYPVNQVIKESQEVVFLCRDEGLLRAQVTWERGDRRPLPPGSRINVTEGRLEIPNIQLTDQGLYICRATGSAASLPGSQISVNLLVESWPQPLTPRPPCAIDQHTCHNGECISQSLTCNGRPDCSDGSDEMRCPKKGAGCEPNEFQCANKRCIQKIWLCDAENDCGDLSDEKNCRPTPPGSVCRSDEFKCFNTNPTQCIPRAFQCDFSPDCLDGSDERGCSSVIITKHPQRNVSLTVGELFTITCETLGIPTPEVVWRLNWGHVPAKCRSTTVEGVNGPGTSVGTLTCPQIAIEDAGAYSCEGINSRGSVFAQDTILVVHGGGGGAGPIEAPCENGVFNSLARNVNECIRCFCFGITTGCRSANLFVYQIQPPVYSPRLINVVADRARRKLEIRPGETNPLTSSIQYLGRNSFRLSGLSNQYREEIYPYFALPETYLGNQLKSYGGFIKYRIRFEGRGSPLLTPDIIISGNGRTLIHTADSIYTSGADKDQSVPLVEHYWFKNLEPTGGDIPASPEPASREEIMMTLVNLDQILLKIQYFASSQIDITISDLYVDTAGTEVTGRQAAFVEECSCPVGYTGLSCESCAAGYERRPGGPWLGSCAATAGSVVNCPTGSYLTRNGTCLRCPCPSFVQSCPRNSYDVPVCRCPEGHTGQRCEFCAPGYTGNPYIAGGCQRITAVCNEAGSTSLVPDPGTGVCRCKQNVVGPYCSQCQPNSFYLLPSYIFGCIRCFCMGVTTNCVSSHMYRNQIRAPFYRDYKIGLRSEVESNPSTNLRADTYGQEIIFTSFIPGAPGAYYWSLPQKFVGNKISSYGGYLNYTIRYVPAPGSSILRSNAPDVELISEDNSISLYYFHRGPVEPNAPQTISVPILEQYWQRSDNQMANREHMLMALADLKAILVRASYATETQQAGLQNVIMDVAEDSYTGQSRAFEVEECRCPPGYRGTSCEECDAGYYRVEQGLYLGNCEPCRCNGHSRDCDSRTGFCVNCANHTTGDHCEVCEPGYVGNPVSGEPCRRIDIDCVCDPRGSLSPDCLNGACSCKNNVDGIHCDSCKPGTFDLQATHSTGCLSCYCSGVSSQCQSSNYFVTQIPMLPLIDENHGFTLTNANRDRVIKTGFKVNFEFNQVTYDYTTERGQELFWSLPPNFTGRKITSYGGTLSWTQGYNAPPDAISTSGDDVVIYGDGISIHWSSGTPTASNTNIARTVKLVENDFRRVAREGTQRASRRDMLRVLSNVESILIRASYASQTTLVFIGDVSLDTAVSQPLSSVRATHIENCRCPTGHKGTSCETCATGFYQVSSQDGYVKECRKCPCNGREESCSVDVYTSRVVCKCQPGFSGEFCDGTTDVTTTYYPPYPTTLPPLLTPNIIVNISEPFISIVASGSTIRLTCSAASLRQRPVRVTWSKEGDSLPSGRAYDDGNGHVVIVNAVVTDSGTYVCTAFDQEYYVAKNISVTVQDAFPPKVAITPETLNGRLDYKSGDLILINCEATGVPTPTIEWSRENGPPIGRAGQPNRNALRIAQASRADSGTYTCRARNLLGADTRSIIIFVQDYTSPVPEPIRLTLAPPEYRGVPGETVRIDCAILSDPGGYRLSWSRLGHDSLPPNTEDRDGTLIIHAADASVSGQYVCKAVAEGSNQLVSESAAQVYIETGSDGREPKLPAITIEPESQTVPQGQLAVIRCTSSSDPTIPVTWRKVNDNFTAGVQILGSELRIPAIQIRDRGVYVCEIENAAGLSRLSSMLEVERREIPEIIIYPQPSQMIVEGGSTIIQCQVRRGTPPPTIRWLRRGQKALTANVEEMKGALRFRSITEEDAGEYICIASNEAGQVDAVANLEVISLPSISISPAGPVEVGVGQSVRLECRASGKPPPNVEWQPTPDGYPRLPDPFVELRPPVPGTAVLVLNAAQLSDSNTYTCIASNVAGRAEERVQLIVSERGPFGPPGPPVPPTPGSSISPDQEITVPQGSNANLRCTSGSKEDSIFTYWSRENNLPLKTAHDSSQPGLLILYNVDTSDSGKYVCTGVSQTTGTTLFSQSLTLRIIAGAPEVTLYPIKQVVRPGDSPYINCSATGSQPIYIYWSSVSGNALPRSASFDKGLLQFNGISVYDAGRYVCRAENSVGQASAVAEVIVSEVSGPRIPIIKAADRIRTALENSNMDLTCYVNATAQDPYQIVWSRERGDLPANSQTSGGTLRILRLRQEDSGRYKCQVKSAYGESEDFIWLQVERINNVTLSIIPRPPTVKVGETVELSCNVEGDDRHSITWSKVDGSFESNVQSYGNPLRINNVQLANIGTYRCSALTKDGMRSIDHHLRIELPPTVSTTAAVSERRAEYGQNIDLICETNLDPPVNYTWVVHSHEKSLRRIVPNTQKLTIAKLNANQSGLYFCNVANNHSFVTIPQVLIVDNVIPRFDGSGYVALPPLIQASENLDIEINFKPTNYDGLLLFNSESRDAKKDFVSLSLQSGYPIFKFNVGSGPAVIRADMQLPLNKWHSIRLMRHKKNGSMEVNGVKYTGSSPGNFETLDLQLPLFIGGHPNYSFTQQVADVNIGFEGCINRLRIDSREVNLHEDAVDSVGLRDCDNCERNPCFNGGFCQETSSSNGYMCICPPGFSGEICEVRKTTCYLDSCGSGQCLENDYGIECLCPFGKAGKNCREDIKIHVPAFTKNSYLAYLPSLLNEKMKLSLRVKPIGSSSVENGLVLFVAKGENGADFISLYTLNSYLQLKFRIKGQVVILQSNHYLVPGEYVTVSLTIDSSQVQFGVANESTIAKEFDPTNEISDFKWHSTMYVGGYDKKSTVLPEDVPVKTGFYGCISSFEILGIDTSILQSYTEAVNINNCYSLFGDVCEATSPCRNGGSCFTTRDDYRCDCPAGFSGPNCERRRDACDIQQPCKNGGTCISTGNSYKCSCSLGFGGLHCGSEINVGYSVAFHADGYIEVPEITTTAYQSTETLLIRFRTKYANGLLFWRGVNDGRSGYMAVAVQNGFVQLAFHTWGSSPKTISASNHRVDDNLEHLVYIQYYRQPTETISLILDGQTTDLKDSVQPLNVRGNIFAGGLPVSGYRSVAQNLFVDGFEGCILDLRINNESVNFSQATSGVNVATCTGS